MKRLFASLTIAFSLMGLIVVPAFTQDTLQGVAIYAVGSFTTPAWSPGDGVVGSGTVDGVRLYDDGLTNGDAVAGDGIWTCRVSGLPADQKIFWKIASRNYGPVNSPDAGTDSLQVLVPSSGTVTFYLDTNKKDDGLLPDVKDATADGIPYTDAMRAMVSAASTVSLVGDFGEQLGGSNWSPDVAAGQVILNDAGTNGDAIAGDGIFSADLTGLSPGVYNFKGNLNLENWDFAKFSTIGYSSGGGNLSFLVSQSSDIIKFILNSNTSRIGAKNESITGDASSFYAHSSAWGEAFTDLENLGSGVDGVFGKMYTVGTPGDYTVRVRNLAGENHPASGGYPFTTSAPNQSVLVLFNRNTLSDASYEPKQDIVVVVDAVTKAPLNSWEYVQPVGDWMKDFGGTGDWMPSDLSFQAFDDGEAGDGDAVAGDGIYTAKFMATATGSDKSLKAVGKRTNASDPDWKVQFGGPGNGVTYSGDNSTIKISYTQNQEYVFQIDTLTGRVGIGTTPPQRPPLELPSNVLEWSLY